MLLIILILLVLWAMGAFVIPVGNAVHVLLIVILILVIIRLLP